MIQKRPLDLVFGGHSPIGLAISQELSRHSKVMHVSRQVDSSLLEKILDYSNISLKSWGKFSSSLTDEQKVFLSAQKCKSLVFAHKYSSNEPNDLEQFEVEVLFPMKIIQYLKSEDLLCDSSSIVFLSSPAADFIVTDQSLNYHLSKAALNQMTRFFACSLAPQTKVNAIAPGSFVLKDRNENYYETNSLLKRSIENFLPLGKMPTVDDIALIVGFLVSEKNKILNGQILDLSGGYLGLEPSQVFSKLSQ